MQLGGGGNDGDGDDNPEKIEKMMNKMRDICSNGSQSLQQFQDAVSNVKNSEAYGKLNWAEHNYIARGTGETQDCHVQFAPSQTGALPRSTISTTTTTTHP
jgi:hypothetical protein